MTTVELAKKLNLSQPSVSQAVVRGQKIAEERGLNLLPPDNQYMIQWTSPILLFYTGADLKKNDRFQHGIRSHFTT